MNLIENPLVYIIDDDLVSQFATQYRLKQEMDSCAFISFDCAKDGLKTFVDQLSDSKQLPDILLLDLEMPIMNGWEFLKEFGNIYNSKIPTEIYVLSSFSNPDDRLKVKNHPLVKGYFNKPLTRLDTQQIIVNKRNLKLKTR
ncbi:Regulator of RpoS [Arenibacter antarcticus]|uniref:Two-component system response regulator n=1 Tax=Arenibacter antarcticus TaxID=2040469 RepID=A0ABW5VFG1_9FLAO|nr:response regulator [Arenibacter sp. H213]MCM4166521.1 response regulator [Arenibacter sp. H213]